MKGSQIFETLIFTVLLLSSDIIMLGRHTLLLGCGLNLSPKIIPCGRLYIPQECVPYKLQVVEKYKKFQNYVPILFQAAKKTCHKTHQ